MDEKLKHALCLLAYTSRVEWNIRSCNQRIDTNTKMMEELRKENERMKQKKVDAIRDLHDANEALEQIVSRVRAGAVDSQKDYVTTQFLKKIAHASDIDHDEAATELRASEIINLYIFTKEK